MAKGKVTKITKDDQTSRRKRTRGLIKKSWELGVRPSCKVFTFVLYTDVNQVKTYDSTGGKILEEVETVINRLVRSQNAFNVNGIAHKEGKRRDTSDWQKSDPSSYSSKRSNKKSNRLDSKPKDRVPPQTDRSRRRLRPAPVFDFNILPMYQERQNYSRVEAAHDQ